MMGYGWGPGLGAGLWMIGGLLLIVGIVFVVAWAVAAIWHGGRGVPGSGPTSGFGAAGSSRSTPDEILRERFARGEITQEEYEQARRVLGLDR